MRKSRFGHRRDHWLHRASRGGHGGIAVGSAARLQPGQLLRLTAKYGGMEAKGAKRLKELESENNRLKPLLAEARLDVEHQRRVRRAGAGSGGAFPRLSRGGADQQRAGVHQSRLHRLGPAELIDRLLIEPGRPMQNSYIESFNGKFRDECLNEHWFTSLAQARAVIAEWRRDYNQVRPHSSCGRMPPAQFAANHRTQVSCTDVPLSPGLSR